MSGFRLSQEITFWLPLANNGTGGKTWVAPVKVDARIAPNNDVVFTAEGKEITANKAVYTRTELPFGAYVVEGDSIGNASPVSAAQQVIKATSNPTMTDMFRALLQ